MIRGQGQLEPVLSPRAAFELSANLSNLNAAQRAAVEHVLVSRDRVLGIQGSAGAGKTTALRLIREQAEARGYGVEGLAPTSRASKQLQQAGIAAGALQAFLARRHEPDFPGEKHLYMVDESSLTSTNQMRTFLTRLGPYDRVVLIGDIRQHQAIEAGKPFEQLQNAGMSTARLEQIVRQNDPGLKAVVEQFAKGQTSARFGPSPSKDASPRLPTRESGFMPSLRRSLTSQRAPWSFLPTTHRDGNSMPRSEPSCSPGESSPRKITRSKFWCRPRI